MTAKTTRILKEARPLFWPWCAVALVGALPLAHLPQSMAEANSAVFWLGVWLLASLAFGAEFQHRTLSLLLSQPVGRMEIWREKLIVVVAAVGSTALIYSLASRVRADHLGARGLAQWGAVLIAITVSATFWTLLAGSTLGGVAFNIAAFYFITVGLNFAYLLYGKGGFSATDTTGLLVFECVFLCYAAATLWLGRLQLQRFQVSGAAAGDDPLTAGPSVLAGWLRSRPTGVALNLFRKEFRLLRLVWLASLLAALGWAGLGLFGFLHERHPSHDFENVVISVMVINTLTITFLAGSFSLGEEKSSGTHAWHLTLPVPARLQWCVKLCVALFTSALGAWLLPLLIADETLLRSSHTFMDVNFGVVALFGVLLLTFAAFWCACAVDGTVAAVLWVVPVMIVLGSAGYFARQWAGDLVLPLGWSGPYPKFGISSVVARIAERYSQVSNLFYNLRFDSWVTGVVFRHSQALNPLDTPLFYAVIAATPALILALVQSYRLFNAPPRNNTRSVVRYLVPLALLVFVCGFSFRTFTGLRWVLGSQVPMLMGTTHRAIQNALTSTAKRDAEHPMNITLDDVVKAWPLRPSSSFPESTRRWLTNARITVMPDKAHPGGFYCQENPTGDRASHVCYFSATIHLADGTDIFESYDPPASNRQGFPPFGHPTFYVHWPGAAGQESLWDR